ncbi:MULTISPECIES: hypothetical protein [unclassified Clostridium]|nr:MULTISPECIES: hypothetical protein [unclassified Clostridium]
MLNATLTKQLLIPSSLWTSTKESTYGHKCPKSVHVLMAALGLPQGCPP